MKNQLRDALLKEKKAKMSRLSKAIEKARREGTFSESSQPHSPVETPSYPQDSKLSPIREPIKLHGDFQPNKTSGSLAIPDGQFGDPNERLVSLTSPSSAEGEQYRSLRYLLEQMHQERGINVVAVTSPSPADGKTVTTLNLAGSLAQDSNARVLVIDADLRLPSVASFLGMKSVGEGLTEAVLTPSSSLADVVRFHPKYNMAVLPSRTSAVAPYEVLKPSRMGAVLQELREHFDAILIDLPPLIYPECLLLEKLVDGYLIVVAANQTTNKMFQQGVETITPEKVLGIVFNRDTRKMSSYYRHYKHAPNAG